MRMSFSIIGLFGLVVVALLVVAAIVLVVLTTGSRRRGDRQRGERTGASPLWWWLALAPVGIVVLIFVLLVTPFVAWRSSDSTSHRYHRGIIQSPEDYEAWQEQRRLTFEDIKVPSHKKWVLRGVDWRQGQHGEWHPTLGRLTFAGRFVGPSGWIAAYSTQPQPTQEKALESARQSAAKHLRFGILHHIFDQRVAVEGSYEDLQRALERTVTAQAIAERDLVLEKFVVERPEVSATDNPRLHHAAVLVRAGPQSLDSWIDKIQHDLKQARRPETGGSSATAGAEPRAVRNLREVGLPLVGLVAVITLLSLFLTAGEKGRFAWPLRILSALLLGALFVGLAMLQGWLRF